MPKHTGSEFDRYKLVRRISAVAAFHLKTLIKMQHRPPIDHNYGQKPKAEVLRKTRRIDYDERSDKEWSPRPLEDGTSEESISIGSIDNEPIRIRDLAERTSVHTDRNHEDSPLEPIPPMIHTTPNNDVAVARIFAASNERITKILGENRVECEKIVSETKQKIEKIRGDGKVKIAEIEAKCKFDIASLLVTEVITQSRVNIKLNSTALHS